MSGVRRAVQVLLTVVVAGASLTVAGGRPAQAGTDAGSDWGDGASAGHASGRSGPSAARNTTVNPATGPDFELPFTCGQEWTGSSRAGHSPNYYAIDFNGPSDLGKPVLATAPGVVITAKTLNGSYGRYVVIDHGNGYSSLYGHLNAIVATVGQYVDQGDLIGYLGSSGNSTGPHLHFEERLNGAYFPPYFHRATFHINSSIVSANCTDRPVIGDWNGDGTSDLGLFRNAAAGGLFYERVGTTSTGVRWGKPGDSPVAGDFDGDRTAQVGVRRLAGGTWYLRSSTGAVASVAGVGNASDYPLAGDWDGNGRANLGLYRWSNHTFYLRSDQGTYTEVHMGIAGSRPIVGDWNGDGKDDVGVQSPGGKYTLLVSNGSRNTWTSVGYGYSTDIPIAGDWNHDGKSDLGVWRPSTAQFILRSATTLAGRYANQVMAWGARR
jgi:Peptidase family M23